MDISHFLLTCFFALSQALSKGPAAPLAVFVQPRSAFVLPSTISSTPPPTPDQTAVTQLLARAGRGEAQATNELFPIVYDGCDPLPHRFCEVRATLKRCKPPRS
jgi:hypothetical protein